MLDETVRASLARELEGLRALADKAIAQVPEAERFRRLDPESNSLAIIVKHMAGNMLSRWEDFLTTDGEKPGRDRDSEFVIAPGETWSAIAARWERGWAALEEAIEKTMRTESFERTLRIRGEPHTILDAFLRQLRHYAEHVGQIVFLAKHLAGPAWKTLSVPRGKSKEFNAAPPPYLAGGGKS